MAMWLPNGRFLNRHGIPMNEFTEMENMRQRRVKIIRRTAHEYQVIVCFN